jgi:hypothetical protein
MGAAAKVETKETKKPIHETWNEAWCGKSKENTFKLLALFSESTSMVNLGRSTRATKAALTIRDGARTTAGGTVGNGAPLMYESRGSDNGTPMAETLEIGCLIHAERRGRERG